ncbi:class I SAM-dependent methyltransferase [Verminephrobacter aporrectodeae subsp. tuberculatae]|uniref:class I SAM-dependent methyltransferase n=1 Tax=Verminephrobacter aporrectodeae TaxID=1110389 RepID=UPI0022431888|nr:class I SAM-dependent methyltransferase [Verminephrobacter aporrectodeae]MCW8164694.1 class I SAM-dependent methyltransferase [Verminephrobacter aporrectodeae subsp. tuberculatae]MCW8169362.1 class I SAM-dependent methyltransferase [Verminephrobacter aporrectodeae subsp. tuberculatae]
MVTQAQSDQLRAYDAMAPLYAQYSSRYRNYLDAVDQLVIDRLEPGIRLLDLGSGDGRRLHRIAAHHGLTDVVAVEPSSAMAALCRQTTGFAVHQLFGDELDRLPQTGFDAITVLWNVFGHMADSSVRLKTLGWLKAKLAPGGAILLDVNNRHNRLAYGRWNIFRRRLLDALAFDEKRGDVHYQWQIGQQSLPSSGHLFTPAEMAGLFQRAGLHVAERLSVNYANGAVSSSPFDGQLFFRLGHAGSGPAVLRG